jgi:adenylate cyclase
MKLGVKIQNMLIGLIGSVFFSLLYVTTFFTSAEDRVYDFFLRFRANRQRINNVVFLDVDDAAIAYNGVFPWPRSITAEGLLRLKEYGALAAIFDIEFIDKGPQGVDSIYLEQGLPADFSRSIADISGYVAEFVGALNAGRINKEESAEEAGKLLRFIDEEGKSLFARAQGVARDNDMYLAQASALFGRSWSTLNLQANLLEGEQAERTAMAEARFAYPVRAARNTHKGNEKNIAVLPALPSFSLAAAGAGFTNVEIDGDGVRRRVYLAQNINDHWYLQLAFSPLINWLGKPVLELYPRKLIVRQAALPEGWVFPSGSRVKDIAIPLDAGGMMLLDWPSQDYKDSYTHHSFAEFSALEQSEAQMSGYARALSSSQISYFAQFDAELSDVLPLLYKFEENQDAAAEAKSSALAETSDEAFSRYVSLRKENREIAGALAGTIPAKVKTLSSRLIAENPENADAIAEEAAYIVSLADYLKTALETYQSIENGLISGLKDKFCILGRVDTGTTDLGVNPFYSEYVNVGTHAVVLDTILSESFITPLPIVWSVVFALVFIPLFFLFTAPLPPTFRTAAGFAGALALFFASALIFRLEGIFIAPLGACLAMITAVIAREIISYRGSEKEKKFYRKAFATYTSEAVADQIAANPSLLQLGGVKRRMSAVFTDVQGFSTISEKLSPEELVSLLNRYLATMSNVVLTNKGTIDKYEGDAIIAFFGAPLEQPDHALRTCLSALEMKRLESGLNKTVLERKMSPSPLLTRIGINTGDMVAGNMGTEKKMNYTIMGDAVNLAARLEGVNKQYGTWILASEDTIRETGNALLTRKLDRVRVVGKSEPVRLYEVLAAMETASEARKKLVITFHQALDYFEKRNWKSAMEGFQEVLALEPADAPAKKYMERCGAFFQKPPLDEWDGVYNLKEK